jgi:acetyl esterase/lipase
MAAAVLAVGGVTLALRTLWHYARLTARARNFVFSQQADGWPAPRARRALADVLVDSFVWVGILLLAVRPAMLAGSLRALTHPRLVRNVPYVGATAGVGGGRRRHARHALDIHLPPVSRSKGGGEGTPVVLLVHGGAWAQGDKAHYALFCRWEAHSAALFSRRTPGIAVRTCGALL